MLNAFLIRKIRLPSIIATLATLSVMQGISLVLRSVPGGEIDPQVLDKLNASVSFMPYAFIGVVVLAAVWDFWLYRTAGGLTARAVGSDEASSRRIGIPSEAINWRAFIALLHDGHARRVLPDRPSWDRRRTRGLGLRADEHCRGRARRRQPPGRERLVRGRRDRRALPLADHQHPAAAEHPSRLPPAVERRAAPDLHRRVYAAGARRVPGTGAVGAPAGVSGATCGAGASRSPPRRRLSGRAGSRAAASRRTRPRPRGIRRCSRTARARRRRGSGCRRCARCRR